jgi:PAS domain S-box-containing protein
MPEPRALSLAEFAALLRVRKDEVIQRWRTAVLEDSAIAAADRLPTPKLLDHIPGLLDQLVAMIQAQADTGGSVVCSEERLGRSAPARSHAHLRFAQGYSVPEAARELLHLRKTIIAMCAEMGVCLGSTTAELVHGTLDETLIYLSGEMVRLERVERERAHARLAAATHRFQGLVNNLDHAVVWEWSATAGRFRFVSERAETLLGYPNATWLQDPETWHNRLHPDDTARVRGLFRAALRERRDRRCDHRVKTADGRVLWLHTGVHVTQADGDTIIQGISVDVTPLKKAEQAFQESQARLAGIVGSAMDAIITVDETHRVVLFNSAAEQIFGYRAAEVLGQPLDRFIPARYRPTHSADIRRFAATGETKRSMGHPGMVSALRANGEEFPVEANISQVEVGGTAFFTVILRDVTERKRSEDARRRDEEKLRTVLATLPSGVFILDQAGRIVEANDVARAIWAGVRYVDIDHLDTYKGWWADSGKPLAAADWAAARALRTGQTAVGEVIDIEAFDGSRKTIVNSARPSRDRNGTIIGAVVAFQDITALRRAEAEASQAARDREDLVSIVSHDLKSPLAAILLNVDLVLRQLPADDQKTRPRAESIHRAAERMNGLIRNLLDISRIRAGRLTIDREAVSAASLACGPLEALSSLASAKNVHLVCDVSPDLGAALADRHRIEQVLQNLLDNAVKFSPAGSVVTLAAQRHGQHLIFSVRDSGPGIPADQLPHLFERFWQAKETASQGSGLGLAIAKGIIEAHGGQIWVKSRVGAGSTFYFSLPVPGARPDTAAGAA